MKKGDKVIVVNSGVNYPFYPNKKAEMGFKDPENKDIISQYTGVIFTVFSKNVHDDEKTILFGIEDGKGRQFLIAKNGLKLVQESELSFDEVFERWREVNKDRPTSDYIRLEDYLKINFTFNKI